MAAKKLVLFLFLVGGGRRGSDGGGGDLEFFSVEQCSLMLCIDGFNNRQLDDASTKFHGRMSTEQVLCKYSMHVYIVKCFALVFSFCGPLVYISRQIIFCRHSKNNIGCLVLFN